MAYLLDSDVLIDISSDLEGAIDYLDRARSPGVISQVTALELLVGAKNKKEVSYLDAFLWSYPLVPTRDSTGRRAYQLLMLYAKSHGLHVFDSIIAATAMDEGLTLVTKKRKPFEMIEGISLQIPESFAFSFTPPFGVS